MRFIYVDETPTLQTPLRSCSHLRADIMCCHYTQVEVLCKRTKAQLDLLTEASVRLNGKTLLQHVSGDVGGSFGKMMAYSLMDVDDYGAKVFDAATKGVG